MHTSHTTHRPLQALNRLDTLSCSGAPLHRVPDPSIPSTGQTAKQAVVPPAGLQCQEHRRHSLHAVTTCFWLYSSCSAPAIPSARAEIKSVGSVRALPGEDDHVEEIHPPVTQPAVQRGWAHNLRATSCTSQIFNQLYIAELKLRSRSGLAAMAGG